MAIGIAPNNITTFRETFLNLLRGNLIRPLPFFITLDSQYKNFPVIIPILDAIDRYNYPLTKGEYIYPENGLEDNPNPYLEKINYTPLIFTTKYTGRLDYVRKSFDYASAIPIFTLFGLVKNKIASVVSSAIGKEYNSEYDVEQIKNRIEVATSINPLNNLWGRALSRTKLVKVKARIKKTKPIVFFFKSLTEMYSGYLDAEIQIIRNINSIKEMDVTFTMNIFRGKTDNRVNNFIQEYKKVLREVSIL